MFSLDAPLQPAIDGFVDPENGEQQHTTHLNNVVMQIHRNTSIQELIQLLGPHLTHVQDKRRARGTLLLAEVLTRLPDLKLNGETTHLLLIFFVERLKDPPSVPSCLKALIALLTLHARVVETADAWMVAQSVLSLSIPNMGQALRKQCFELVQHIVRVSGSAWQSESKVIMEGFLTAMEGEKDPRNLLLCLNLASELLTTFPSDADLIQSFFNVTSCYFPITFKPPPNDPYGITSEQLVMALRSVFVARDTMAKYVFPMVLDKLSRTTVPAMTIDMLDTIGFCITRYPLNRLLSHFQPVAAALYHHIVHGENQAIIAAATTTLRTVARAVAPPSKLPGMQALAWSKFVVFIVEKAMDDLRNNAMDSMVSLRAATVLTSVAGESAAGFAYVLETSLSFLLQQCQDERATDAAFACVVALLDCIDTDVVHTTPPLQPAYVTAIQTTFIQGLDRAPHRAQRLCLQGLAKLVLRPPTSLLDDASVHTLLDLWSRIVLTNASGDVRQESKNALQATAMKSPALAEHVLSRCLPQLMAVVQAPHPCELSNRPVHDLLRDVLDVVGALAMETSIFMAILLPLCRLALGSGQNPHEYSQDIMAAVATIVRANSSKAACMDYCVIAQADRPLEASAVQLLVESLVGHVRQGTFTMAQVEPFLNATAEVSGLVMQFASQAAQEALLGYILSLFLSSDISPLRPDATLAQLQLVPLLASVLYASGAALPVIQPQLSTLLPRLFNLAQRRFPEASPTAAAATTGAMKSIAALLNAMPDDELFQRYMVYLTSPSSTSLLASSDDISGPTIASILQDTSLPHDVRLSALRIYLYGSKAIILRAHTTYVPMMVSFVWSLLASDVRLDVAQDFHILLDDVPDCLNLASHATISPVHRQRTFTMVFPLVSSSSSTTVTMEQRVATLLVVAHTPQAILLPYLRDLVPWVVDALTHHEAPYAALLSHPALTTFKMCLREDPGLVQAYFPSVFPGLLWQSQHSPAVKDRLAALECLGSLASTKYELIHPYKDSVIKALLGPLDDRKRAVRQAAVKVRNTWSIL
ncbi:unnamed protein product [Aphanomyces euteiches]|nr:hypothetical protein AeRB84_021100 [Aphanomyces euteiches]